MALIDNSPFTPNIRGKIGGTSFSSGLSGRVVKTAGRRTNSTSQRSAQSKSILDYVTSCWINLTNAQRAAWSAMATFKPTSQKRNVGKFINGQQYFILYNEAFYRLTGTVLTTPNISIYAWSPITVQIERSGSTLRIVASTTVDEANLWLSLKVSGRMLPSQSNPKGGTKLMPVIFSGTTFGLITNAYTLAYGALPVAGDWVYVEYRWFARNECDFTNITRTKIQVI